MANRITWIGSLLLVLLVASLGLASQAQAGAKFYLGSYKHLGYGNTRTDGHKLDSMTVAASTWTVNTYLAEPAGVFCNYQNPTQMSPACASPPTGYTRCFISTGYDPPREELAQPCVVGATPPVAPITGSNTARTTVNPFTTAMGAIACAGGACAARPAIMMPGAPTTLRPDGLITFIGGVAGMGSGSAINNYPGGGNIIYSVTYLTLGTGKGTFFPGGGPAPLKTAMNTMNNPILATPGGNDIFTYRAGPGAASGYIAVDPGPNGGFGGTMKLLGRSSSNQFWFSPVFGGYLNTSLKFLFEQHGGGDNAIATWLAYTKTMGTAPRPSDGYRGQRCPFLGTYSPATYGPAPFNPCPSRTTNFAGRTDGNMSPDYTPSGALVTDNSMLILTNTKWTTGVAVVTGPGFGFTTVIQRTGFDNRTPTSGLGTIQLVAPNLTNWFFGQNASSLGGIAILKLQFVPEITSWMALGSGVLVLGLLDRVRARRARR